MNEKIIFASMCPFDAQMAPHLNMVPLFFRSKWKFFAISPKIPGHKDIPGITHHLVDGYGNKAFMYLMMLWLLFRHTVLSRNLIFLSGSSICLPFFLISPFISGRRIVYQTQDFLEPNRHPFWCFFEKRVARKAALVVVNEENRGRFLASLYKLRKLPVVLRTSLPKDYYKPSLTPVERTELLIRLGLPTNKILILNPGGYAAIRCTPYLVQALMLLPQNVHLVFSGVTESDVSKYAARDPSISSFVDQLTPRMHGVGRLNYKDLLELMATCHVGILLYPNDGVGNYYQCPGRMAEYLGCGLPFVTSNFPGLELQVLKYQLGATCVPYDPQSIAAAIIKVSNFSEEDRARLKALSLHELSYDEQSKIFESAMGRVFKDLQ